MFVFIPASHAHTLLLDLEHLEVVANIDKIKLDSSSTACSRANNANIRKSHAMPSTHAVDHNVDNIKWISTNEQLCHSQHNNTTTMKTTPNYRSAYNHERNANYHYRHNHNNMHHQNNIENSENAYTNINQRNYPDSMVVDNTNVDKMGFYDQFFSFSKSDTDR